MSEPSRAALTLRWHAFTGAAAVAVTIAAWLGATDVRAGGYESRVIHLGVTAPVWLLAAWQLLELRRRAAAPSGALAAASLCALAAAAAAIGAELLTDMAAPEDLRSLEWVALIGLLGVLAAAGWMIAACVGMIAMSHRLARGTLHLPNVRLRERALRFGTAFWLIPWSLLLGFCIAFLGHPLVGIGACAAGVLALLAMQLALADLIAKSRELATAAVRGP